ncbi:uncharacterized protein B4U79_07481, partial [Dinothrombium tinctorium]|uniref:Mitochondrial assembly of ribosomal large subunit protein 1 n=1 Tax=Dinothrombium tinctorium TaxID=1965070 RepID=A0A443QA76_9ACAR
MSARKSLLSKASTVCSCSLSVNRCLRQNWRFTPLNGSERCFCSSSDDHDEQKKLSPSFTSKFKLFNEHDSNVVLDFDEARFLKEGEKENKKSVESGKFLYQQKKKFDFENISLERGKHCVIDIDELVDILRQERMSDIAVISVPKELKYCDYMVIASAMSTRHLRAVCEFIRLVYKAKKHLEDPFVIVEGENSNDWKVFDMDSIVLHLMLPETRNLYDIETLWTCGAEHDNLTQKQVQDPIVDLLQKHTKFLDDLSTQAN